MVGRELPLRGLLIIILGVLILILIGGDDGLFLGGLIMLLFLILCNCSIYVVSIINIIKYFSLSVFLLSKCHKNVRMMEKELEELLEYFEDKKNVIDILTTLNDKYSMN